MARVRPLIVSWRPILLAFTICAATHADDSLNPTTRPAVPPPVTGKQDNVPDPEARQSTLTDAEKIARLQRSIEDDGRLLQELRDKLNAPDSEYSKAEREFTHIDGQLETKRKEAPQSLTSQPQDELGSYKTELRELEAKHKLAKDRFDLAIRERKVLQEQVATLEKKIQQDQAALGKLKGEPAPPTSQPTLPHSAKEAATTLPSVPPLSPAAAQRTAAAPTTPAVPTPAGSPPLLPGSPGSGQAGGVPPVTPPKVMPSPELEKARVDAADKQVQAQEAAKEARSVTERMEAAHKAIALEQKLLQTVRERSDNARKTERTLYDELQTKWQAGAPPEQLAEPRQKINDARSRLWEAEREIRERTDRISKLQDELSGLQSEQIAALKQAEQKRLEAESAQKRVKQLENPWSPQNLLRWLLEHGPRVLGIIIGMAALLWLSHIMEDRIVKLLAGRAQHSTHEDQENRARTLVGVFRSAVAIVIYTGGTLMVLTELGVNIIPLMGGAAVIGLAVAFGAQNLIRDYFYGFMILLENQYTINDVVKLGEIAGQVENITLRITVLRGLDGTVHFVPNGQITQVSNMTHGWSRALFEIAVSYKEDVDQVMATLVELGKELRRDPEFRGMILEMPEMLGVDEFSDSAIVIKFFIKTKPLKQWTVKRELLRRIKRKFDELDIEIPFPHRTVYHRVEDNSPLAGAMASWATAAKENDRTLVEYASGRRV
ncbi:MAG TPA: mechanosensitive ion channel [Phycisphaerae bacterium]|nr:mechanosensitive ion channel [Phycisphaerae bacterium]HRY69111.1 mechanosensitive ion channel [Phycisphaerae bacterium]HSA29457.1 mechanosensitive ion channel [Phycisphaerae bacterium]